jgi:hypothetical protein
MVAGQASFRLPLKYRGQRIQFTDRLMAIKRGMADAGQTSAGVANAGNAVIGTCLWRPSLLRVGRRICIRGRLFLFAKPWRQVFQRGLSVADRCLEHRKIICALRSSGRNRSRLRGRFLDCLNGLHQDRRHQGNYHHEWSDKHGLPPCLCPSSASKYSIRPSQVRTVASTFMAGFWTGAGAGENDNQHLPARARCRVDLAHRRRPLLFGVSRDLCGAHDIDEPRHWNEVDHRSNGYCQQPGTRYLPAWIPSAHHSPLSVARGSEPVGAIGRRKTGRSPRARHYATSHLARNKKLPPPDHVPVTTRSGALHLTPSKATLVPALAPPAATPHGSEGASAGGKAPGSPAQKVETKGSPLRLSD